VRLDEVIHFEDFIRFVSVDRTKNRYRFYDRRSAQRDIIRLICSYSMAIAWNRSTSNTLQSCSA